MGWAPPQFLKRERRGEEKDLCVKTVKYLGNGVYANDTHTHRDRKWLTATWGRGLGGGLNPIVMSIHDRSIWLEARFIARSLARLSGGVPNEQCICCAVFQLGLPLLFHGLLQGRDVARDGKDLKRLFWLLAV